MAKLILSENMRVLDEFPLDRDCITIGRRGDNDIQIDDRAVSGYHCQILTVLNDSFLEDLQSTNGTYVNSKRVTKHALHNGDIIILGTHQLQYENELASGEDDDRYDKTMVIRPTLDERGVDSPQRWTPQDPQRHQQRQTVSAHARHDHAGQTWPAGRRDHPPWRQIRDHRRRGRLSKPLPDSQRQPRQQPLDRSQRGRCHPAERHPHGVSHRPMSRNACVTAVAQAHARLHLVRSCAGAVCNGAAECPQ
ncbi:MAG: FHA domain-containing protein [Acidihalobacter sp.]